MEVPDAPVDRQREKDAGDRASQEFAHGEHVAAHPERRQDLEHVIVGCLANPEPLAAIERTTVTLPPVGALGMAVEHTEHLMPVGDTLEYLADRREVHDGLPFSLVGPERGSSLRWRHLLFSPS
ncbi:hypothetical protein D3C71_1494650 [compost metagenome]